MDSQLRIAELEAFLRFSQVEWPTQRDRFAESLTKRCTRCIVSERFSALVDGLCAHCRSGRLGQGEQAHPRWGTPAMVRELDRVLLDHRGVGRRYDALVLFSGGKDSAYLLNRLLSDYSGLRLLAVTIDNSFFSSVAMANAGRIIDRLKGVDHLIFRPAPRLFEKTFRYAFTHLNPGGCYSTVDRMDGDLAFDIGRNLAAEFDIPLVIAGLSPEQVERILNLQSFESDRKIELQRRTESAGFDLSTIYSADEMGYWWNGTAWPAAKVPRVLYPFYAWPYDEDAIRLAVIESGLIEAGRDNPLITNNDTIPLMLAVDICFLGYSGFEPEFAELIRQGRAEREPWLNMFQAMEYLTREGRFVPRCLDDTLGRLGLTRHDVGLPHETGSSSSGM